MTTEAYFWLLVALVVALDLPTIFGPPDMRDTRARLLALAWTMACSHAGRGTTRRPGSKGSLDAMNRVPRQRPRVLNTRGPSRSRPSAVALHRTTYERLTRSKECFAATRFHGPEWGHGRGSR